ncbi:MAG: methyltransferase domain-containing protein [Marinifilaceae bacterium]|jgi:SAM-dependent methyltransferase|nr:methyltransferase domain-containing protein [Marinifilaceae bacterium]
MNKHPLIEALESSGAVAEPAFKEAINSLHLENNAKVLDVACGIGTQAKLFIERYPQIHITGIDIVDECIQYAKKLNNSYIEKDSCIFEKKDMNNLKFADNTFDLVWCCNGLWPGSSENGCPAEEPYKILEDMVRITKPGGQIAILFFSSQRLLQGYSKLEAELTNTNAALGPTDTKKSELHFMKTPLWLKNSGLANIKAKTFAVDIQAPMSEIQKAGAHFLMYHLYAQAEYEIPKDRWEVFKKITDINSKKYILNQEEYSGFFTYTMYTGIKNK